jgi:hypothetical protein
LANNARCIDIVPNLSPPSDRNEEQCRGVSFPTLQGDIDAKFPSSFRDSRLNRGYVIARRSGLKILPAGSGLWLSGQLPISNLCGLHGYRVRNVQRLWH